MTESFRDDSIVLLSHALNSATPGFGGATVFSKEVASSIAAGKSSNSSIWRFSNHSGTHIDVPYHFSDSGQTITDFKPETWFFKRPCLVEYPARPDELIDAGEWLAGVPDDTDLLIIRTGFEEFRDKEQYWKHNPGLAPGFAAWLRQHRPFVRCVGFDFISLTAFQHREVGRESHRQFLCTKTPILIIEDMALKKYHSGIKTLIVSPLMVAGADGAPVTIFGYCR